MKFEKNPGWSNEILEGDGFYISYNPNPGMGISLFDGDDHSDETALVKEDDTENRYRILNGDYRKEYEKLAPLGFEKCLKFYNKESIDNGSSWSTNNVGV